MHIHNRVCISTNGREREQLTVNKSIMDDVAKHAQQDWIKESGSGPTMYFSNQYVKPYRSTVMLHEWLKRRNVFAGRNRIADVACGMGAPTAYFASKEPQCEFTGLDFNPLLVKEAQERSRQVPNARFEEGNIYQLQSKYYGKFDGILSLQTLSWLDGYEEPVRQMAAIDPRWIAITSLFFDGPVDARISIQDYSKPMDDKPFKDAFYNTYSLPRFKEFMRRLGYHAFDCSPFEIDCDLERIRGAGMDTYTRRLEGGVRLQISGPLLMNWYFILASK